MSELNTVILKDRPVRDVVRIHHCGKDGIRPVETYVRLSALPEDLRAAVFAAVQKRLSERAALEAKKALAALPLAGDAQEHAA